MLNFTKSLPSRKRAISEKRIKMPNFIEKEITGYNFWIKDNN